MNKIIKRFLGVVLFGLLLALSINPVQATEVTTIGGARYYVEETIVENDLPYGVKQYTDISYASAAAGMCISAAAGSGGGGVFIPDYYYPQQVNVLEVPSVTEVKVVPWSKMSQGVWNLATIKATAADFETRNPDYKVIAAINGDFFDINANKLFPRTPSGAHVALGEFYKTITGRAVGFKNDGSTTPLVGNTTPSRTSKMTLSIYDGEGNITHQFDIDKINASPSTGETAIYYGNWELQAGWSAQRIVPINVENAYIIDNGEFALPIATNDFYGKGTITSFGSSELSTGDFAIATNNATLDALLNTGVKVRAQFGFTGAFAGVENVIGVGQTILYQGDLQGDDKNRHPRTMVGVKADGTIVMTVVDGRQPDSNMYGATQTEMAAILKHYGAVDGYNLDGGGSSTMIVLQDGEFKVMNQPSDGWERSDANGIMIAVKVPKITHSVSDIVPTGFTVNATITNKNGIDFDRLFVKVNDQYVEVIDGKAEVTGLAFNASFGYAFFGQKGEEEKFPLIIESRTNTGRRTPALNYVKMTLDGTDLIVEINVTDVDTALTRRTVEINGQVVNVVNNRAMFSGVTNVSIDDIKVNLGYDLKDGAGRIDVVMTELRIRCGLNIYMNITKNTLQETVQNIYKIQP